MTIHDRPTQDIHHIVVFTGAGISAESGLQTFRDRGGLWEQFPLEEVATPSAWKKDPAKVLHFYNLRRQQVREAQPNAAHLALAKLQQYFQVDIITQNIDDLHERAGSFPVLHLHGELMKARSTVDDHLLYDLDGNDISLSDRCAKGSQLRPHVVWFGEPVPEFEKACGICQQTDLMLVIGTSLQIYPAAQLLDFVVPGTPIILIAPQMESVPAPIAWYQDTAVNAVPKIVERLINNGSV